MDEYLLFSVLWFWVFFASGMFIITQLLGDYSRDAELGIMLWLLAPVVIPAMLFIFRRNRFNRRLLLYCILLNIKIPRQ